MKPKFYFSDHKKSAVCAFCAGALITVYGAFMHVRAGFGPSVLAVYLLGVFAVCAGLYMDLLLKRRWIVISVIAAAAAFACAVAATLIYPAARGASYTEDAVIILGAGLKENEITPQLAERLDTGVEYYKRNPNAVIVVSGGKGSEEKLSEAEAMEEYLVSKGIPQSAIIKEDRSVSTYTNFYYTKQILDTYFENGYKVAVVTSRYHMLRAGAAAKYAGLDISCLCADTPLPEIPLRYLREFFALIAYLFCILFGIL